MTIAGAKVKPNSGYIQDTLLSTLVNPFQSKLLHQLRVPAIPDVFVLVYTTISEW